MICYAINISVKGKIINQYPIIATGAIDCYVDVLKSDRFHEYLMQHVRGKDLQNIIYKIRCVDDIDITEKEILHSSI